MTTESTSRSYAQRYCELHRLKPESFVRHLTGRSLHAPLRWVWIFVKIFNRNYTRLDEECVSSIGKMQRREDVYTELAEFSYAPGNHSLWRRTLKQRLSSHRLMRNLRKLPK